MKNSPSPLLFIHQTLQLALCIQVCRVLLASTKPRFVRQIARWCSIVHCSIVQWQRALPHSSQRLALRMVILNLCVAARPLKPIFMKRQTNNSCSDIDPETVWNSVVKTDYLYPLQHSAVTFCELVWPTSSRLSRCSSETFPLHNNSTYI